jgi:hypothetical protein
MASPKVRRMASISEYPAGTASAPGGTGTSVASGSARSTPQVSPAWARFRLRWGSAPFRFTMLALWCVADGVLALPAAAVAVRVILAGKAAWRRRACRSLRSLARVPTPAHLGLHPAAARPPSAAC